MLTNIGRFSLKKLVIFIETIFTAIKIRKLVIRAFRENFAIKLVPEKLARQPLLLLNRRWLEKDFTTRQPNIHEQFNNIFTTF